MRRCCLPAWRRWPRRRSRAAAPGRRRTPARRRPDRRGGAPAADAPLSVTIDSIGPSYIPAGAGPGDRVGDQRRRRDLDATVSVYSFVVRRRPITHVGRAGRRPARPTPPPTSARGSPTPGTYDTLDRTRPGQSRQFSITVPRAELARRPSPASTGSASTPSARARRSRRGRRRAGAHVPAAGRPHPPGRRHRARGAAAPRRAPRGRRPADLRARLGHGAGPGRPARHHGRLRGLRRRPADHLAGGPALPDAVAVARRRQPAPLGWARRDPIAPAPHEQQLPSTGPEPQPSASAGDDASATNATDATTAKAAAAWLDRLEEGLRGSQVLALPYGDMDVAAAAGQRPCPLPPGPRAQPAPPCGRLGAHRSAHAVAPPNGFLDRAGLRLTPSRDTVLVTRPDAARRQPDAGAQRRPARSWRRPRAPPAAAPAPTTRSARSRCASGSSPRPRCAC